MYSQVEEVAGVFSWYLPVPFLHTYLHTSHPGPRKEIFAPPHKSDYDVVGSLTKIKVFPWGELPRRLLKKPEFQSASEMQARAPDSYFFLSLSLSHATCPSTAESSVTTLGSSDTLA